MILACGNAPFILILAIVAVVLLWLVSNFIVHLLLGAMAFYEKHDMDFIEPRLFKKTQSFLIELAFKMV